MRHNKIQKQQGAALAISLILMVVMTILGIATLNGTRLAEKISSNAQQKAIVYETAESVINAIYNSVDFDERLEDTRTTKFEPAAVAQNIETAAIANELDQSNALGVSVDVNAEAEIQFCVEKYREGSELGNVEDNLPPTGYHYDVRATSTIDNSRARAEHVLRVEVGGPVNGFKGNCVTPGQ